MAYVNVDVDVDDLVYALSKKEKQELANELCEDGILPKNFNQYSSIEELDVALLKMIGKSIQLTSEEVQLIIDLSKKVI
jgi:hypothetical protein